MIALLFLSFAATSFAAETQQIGVYYHPGWSPGLASGQGPTGPEPWIPIRAFPEREPLLGWYNDARAEIVEQQLQWMNQFGISFVAFNWFWQNGRPAPETSVRAYLQAPSRAQVKYVLHWCNHFKQADFRKEWGEMVDYWLHRHLKNPEYLQIDGRPVVFIFSGDFLRDNAAQSRTTTKELLDAAQEKARAAGLKGIYFVMQTSALEYWVNYAIEAGFDALSAYNYHSGFTGTAATETRWSHNFRELDEAYRMQWKWIVGNSRIPYFVPIGSGWDSRPWGGWTKDPRHDLSVPAPHEFEAHLRAAKLLMDTYPAKTKRIAVICCWNEFGEGSYIEPTKRKGFEFLQSVRKVFGAAK